MKYYKKLGKDGRFVFLSYLKGIAHASIIPYALLWIFQGLGLWAFGVSAAYIIVLAIGYYFSNRHDLSGAAFFGTLGVAVAMLLIVLIIAEIGTFV